MAKRRCKTGRERDKTQGNIEMFLEDGNLINFIFVVCLELVLWFLFLLWNLYCGFIDQNDNEIQIFIIFFSLPPRSLFVVGLSEKQLGMALPTPKCQFHSYSRCPYYETPK